MRDDFETDAIGVAMLEGELVAGYRYVHNSPTNLIDPSGQAAAPPTKNNYRSRFRAVTPDAPEDWPVHHTYDQRLEKRLAAQGINIHEPKHLRAIPLKHHEEINRLQDAWWRNKMACGGYKSLQETYEKVPMSEIEEFRKSIETSYADVWLESGKKAGAAKKVQKILAKLDDPAEALNRAKRMTSILERVGVAFKFCGFFLMIANSAMVAKGLAAPNEAQKQSFNELMEQYNLALNESLEKDTVSKNRMHHTINAFDAYMQSLGIDDRARNLITTPLRAQIDFQ